MLVLAFVCGNRPGVISIETLKGESKILNQKGNDNEVFEIKQKSLLDCEFEESIVEKDGIRLYKQIYKNGLIVTRAIRT